MLSPRRLHFLHDRRLTWEIRTLEIRRSPWPPPRVFCIWRGAPSPRSPKIRFTRQSASPADRRTTNLKDHDHGQLRLYARQGRDRSDRRGARHRAAGAAPACAAGRRCSGARVRRRMSGRAMGKRTWKLTEDLKPYIVVRLPRYHSISANAKRLGEGHGIEITRQASEQ